MQMQQHWPLGTSLSAFSALLKACRDAKDVRSGAALHAEIARKWSLSKMCLHSNILIDMYLGCGCLSKAQEVFDGLVVRDVVSWTSLMSGYVKHDLSECALDSFEEMKIQGVCPNAFTYVCFLKACGSVGAVQKGKELHAHLEREKLWESDPILGNALVDMYVRCGLLSSAQDLFDNLPIRDVVTWTTLIGGYANHGLGMEALDCYKKMQGESVLPNAHTYVCSLKACGILRDATNGEKIHVNIMRQDLLKNQMVGSTLIDMYAKCGLLAKAHEVFNRFHIQDVISWNALIMGYIRHGRPDEALSCYEKMQLKGVSPNAITYVTAVKACASAGATEKGEAIHAEISTKRSLERSLLVGSALVDMYTKCDSLKRAQEVFDNMLERDVVTSNALIAGYVDHDCYDQALVSLEKMESEGLTPDGVTFSCVLKACGGIGDSDKGRQIHCEAARKGLLLEKEPFLGNALIDMYVKSGLLSKAREVLDELPVQDVVSWTTLIGGYVDQDHGRKALDFFEQMRQEGVLPNPVTLICILKACGAGGAIAKGQEIHANVVDQGLLESNLMVGSAIVDMYAKCGRLKEAQGVFDELEGKDIVSWNSLISGYAQQNRGIEALACLAKMRSGGVSPNTVTFISSLKACGSIGCADMGQRIEAEIGRRGLPLHESSLGNALIDMHAKCGSPARAREVFDKLPVRDVVSWNSLIAGYANSEQGKAALECLEKMEAEGIIPDAATFAGVLKACGGIGAMERGEEVYAEMLKKGLAEHAVIGNAAVDLYARCRPLGEAEQLFDKLAVRDVVAWNALIAGYAQVGENRKALQAFARMRDEGQAPDAVTFIGVLNACRHALRADEAQAYFDSMRGEHGIAPALEHYTCLADVLGRAGHVDRALGLLEKMPWKADLVAWHAILDGCRKWGSEECGEKAFRRASAALGEMDASSSHLPMRGICAEKS